MASILQLNSHPLHTVVFADMICCPFLFDYISCCIICQLAYKKVKVVYQGCGVIYLILQMYFLFYLCNKKCPNGHFLSCVTVYIVVACRYNFVAQ